MAGTVALVAVVALWATAQLGQRRYYEGGLALYALLTLLVIVGAMTGGPAARALAFRPLVSVGVVSYGAYLFHWPVFVWLDLHTPLPPFGRLLVGLPLTLVLAAASYRFVERPIRTGTLRLPSGGKLLGPVAMAAAVLLVIGVTAVKPGEAPYDFDAALARSRTSVPEALADLSPEEQAKAVRLFELNQLRADLAATGKPTIASYGDSTALITGIGLSTFAEATFKRTRRAVSVPTLGWAQLGCGLVTTGHRTIGGKRGTPPKQCATWVADWRRTVTAHPVDIAYVEVGTWDVLDQQPAGFARAVHIGDPKLDALLRDRLEQGVAALSSHAKLIVLALSPDIEVGRIDGRSPDEPLTESDPARMRRFRALLSSVAAAHDDVETVDLAGWVDRQPDEQDLRPDGIHLTDPAALRAAAWLAPELVRIYDAWRAASGTPPP